MVHDYELTLSKRTRAPSVPITDLPGNAVRLRSRVGLHSPLIEKFVGVRKRLLSARQLLQDLMRARCNGSPPPPAISFFLPPQARGRPAQSPVRSMPTPRPLSQIQTIAKNSPPRMKQPRLLIHGLRPAAKTLVSFVRAN